MAIFEGWQQERRAYIEATAMGVYESTHCPSSTCPEQETMFGTSRAGRTLHLSNSDQFRDLRVAWITVSGWSVPRARSWGISSIGTFQFWTVSWYLASDIYPSLPPPPPPAKKKRFGKRKTIKCEPQMIEIEIIWPFWTTSNKYSLFSWCVLFSSKAWLLVGFQSCTF